MQKSKAAPYALSRLINQNAEHLLFLLNSEISAGLFQCGDHLLGRNQAGIKGHRVDLMKSSKALRYFENPWQPFQSCFTDIVSVY